MFMFLFRLTSNNNAGRGSLYWRRRFLNRSYRHYDVIAEVYANAAFLCSIYRHHDVLAVVYENAVFLCCRYHHYDVIPIVTQTLPLQNSIKSNKFMKNNFNRVISILPIFNKLNLIYLIFVFLLLVVLLLYYFTIFLNDVKISTQCQISLTILTVAYTLPAALNVRLEDL